MSWMSWQIDYLLLLQNFRQITNGILDGFFLFISQLGVMPLTIIVICTIYWGINKKLGIYMIYCYSLSYLVNMFLKFSFCIYRPWILDARIQPTQYALDTAPGYSFPSGHTAGAVSLWGSVARYFKEHKIIIYLCALIIFLVMLSRNYLGVHTPQDVIVSLIVGIFILFIAEKIIKLIDTNKYGYIVFLSVITALCIALGLYLVLKSYPVDYVNGILLYDVTDAKLSAIAMIFNIFAIFLGCFLEAKFINFQPGKGSIIRKCIIILLGLFLLFSMENHLSYLLSKFVDFQTAKCISKFITGLFITFIYPCFIKMTEKFNIKSNEN